MDEKNVGQCCLLCSRIRINTPTVSRKQKKELNGVCDAHESELRTSCESEMDRNQVIALMNRDYTPFVSVVGMSSILPATVRNQNYAPPVSRK